MSLRHAAGWCGIAAVLALAAFGFDRYGHWRLQRHLDDAAVTRLAAALHGQSPYRWDLRREDDVIAGRAFGPTTTHFDEAGFHVLATADAGVQVGLVLQRPVDLAHFDQLDVTATTSIPLAVSVVLRETLAAPECRSAVTRLAQGDNRIDLGTLDWRCAGSAAATPDRAAMFRLQFELRRGQTLILRAAELHPAATPSDAARTAFGPTHRMPSSPDDAALARFAVELAPETQPLVELPDNLRVERILALRDALWRAVPAAVPIAAGSAPEVIAQAQALAWPPAAASRTGPWIVAALWVLVLAGIRLRPPRPPQLRALAEIAASLGGPLWFALGGNDATASGAMVVASLVFAASIARHGATWRLVGPVSSWVLPALSVAAALLLVALLRNGTPSVAREEALPEYALRYLAWAAIQQWLICTIVMDRAARVFGTGPRAIGLTAIAFTAIAFALMHAPNPMLMQLTLAGGVVWTANWLRHRALLPNILAHAACGIVLANALPLEWLRSAEVGVRYFF